MKRVKIFEGMRREFLRLMWMRPHTDFSNFSNLRASTSKGPRHDVCDESEMFQGLCALVSEPRRQVAGEPYRRRRWSRRPDARRLSAAVAGRPRDWAVTKPSMYERTR